MGRLFAIQITVISLATLIGIYLTQLVVEDLLSRQALNLESEHFWKRYREDPHHPLPDVANMTRLRTAVEARIKMRSTTSTTPDESNMRWIGSSLAACSAFWGASVMAPGL